MRRTLAALAATLVTLGPVTVGLVSPAATGAEPAGTQQPPVARLAGANPDPRGPEAADAALDSATAILGGRDGRDGDKGGGEGGDESRSRLGAEATLALRALRLSYDDLSPAEQQRADRLLARPIRSQLVCGARVCVHYAPSGSDGTTRAWALATLRTMERVWSHHIGIRGYRPPAPDGGRGGTARFDVYLEDLLDNGLYGYCAAESRVPGQPSRYAGYCVLDNDYQGYPLDPGPTLRVTAAHEFFHAIQFNYDAGEDGWIMETTATWMEEVYADDVNDNRAYLRYSQLRNPWRPLDLSNDPQASPAWYGNWLIFQRLSQRFGPDSVRAVWNRLDAAAGRPDEFSVQALRNYLFFRGGARLPTFYADFGIGNAFPGRHYAEGAAYQPAPVNQNHFLGARTRVATDAIRLNHLTYQNHAFYPTRTLTGRWRMRVRVDGPWGAGPGAYVAVAYRDGRLARAPISLNRFGDGYVTVNFTRSQIVRVMLSVANAGTAYRCWVGGNVACRGTSLSNNLPFRFSGTALR